MTEYVDSEVFETVNGIRVPRLSPQRWEELKSCVCDKKFSADHAFSCLHGGFPSVRHNEVREITADLLTEFVMEWVLSLTYNQSQRCSVHSEL